MFIPLGTDRYAKRRPRATEALILANVLVYLIGLAGSRFGWFDLDQFIAWGHYDPREFRAWQTITYQFLHDPYSIFHLLFNMLFLWVFGAAVESRLGHASFLGVYLVGGVIAAIAHDAVSAAPVIGASGAVAGITGAFLALFPRSRIRVLLFFFIIGVYEVPAVWFIGLYFAIDVLNQLTDLLGRGGSDVAYAAHIAGYLYGFFLAFTLLGVGIVKREEFDVVYLFKQARRRAAFRAASRSAPTGMWDSAQADTGERLAKQAKKSRELDEQTQAQAARRAEINRLAAAHDLPAAAREYRLLLRERPAEAVLAEPRQIDLANQLYSEGDAEAAAQAYELYLSNFPAAGRADEVRLMLGLIYTRRLARPERAKELLEHAKARLRNEGQAALATQLLAELT